MALAGDLFEDRVAVLVPVIEGAEDDGVDVAADEIGTDGAVVLLVLFADLFLAFFGATVVFRREGRLVRRGEGGLFGDVYDVVFVFAMGKFLIHRESPYTI